MGTPSHRLEAAPAQKAPTGLQTQLVEVVAAAAVALTQVVTAAVWGSDLLKFKAPALAGAGGVGPGRV